MEIFYQYSFSLFTLFTLEYKVVKMKSVEDLAQRAWN